MRISDWSSDVCSSDLQECNYGALAHGHLRFAALSAVHPKGFARRRELNLGGGKRFGAGRRGLDCHPGHHICHWARLSTRALAPPRGREVKASMNGRSITLFELLGFKIRVDFSWLFLAVLVTWSLALGAFPRSEEHTSELQSLMRISYA